MAGVDLGEVHLAVAHDGERTTILNGAHVRSLVIDSALALHVMDKLAADRLFLGGLGSDGKTLEVIGAVLGLAVVLGSRDSIRLGVMLLLLAVNVAAEMVSFSSVIDAVPPLRWFDRLGSRRPRSIA